LGKHCVMNAIITGDIVGSRKAKQPLWLDVLKEALQRYGSSPRQWEIFRGDSFQLELPPQEALRALFHLKAVVKQFKELDVRLALGLGDVAYRGEKITESNGSAFIHSGERFDALKKETLGIKTPWPELDKVLDLMLQLAALKADEWTVNSALIIKTVLEHPEARQTEVAQWLNKQQSDISKGLKRGGFEALERLFAYYSKSIAELC